MSLLDVTGLTAGYGGEPVLQDVSFSLEEGWVTGLLGANGSGKTTLLKAICGILPHRGRCLLNGARIEDLKPRALAQLCSYVPQRSGINIDLSLWDVVCMGFNPRLGLLEEPRKEQTARAEEALRAVGLWDRRQESFLTLSQGQKQLCILARAFVADSRLLIMDEPENALDLQHRQQLLRLTRQWLKTEGRSVLLSLHDPGLALNRCDRLLLLKEGRICALLHPKEDPLPQMEAALEEIYGPLTLARCRDKQGCSHLTVLYEEDL